MSEDEKNEVYAAQADYLFDNQEFTKAAQAYSKTDIPFETIALKFLGVFVTSVCLVCLGVCVYVCVCTRQPSLLPSLPHLSHLGQLPFTL